MKNITNIIFMAAISLVLSGCVGLGDTSYNSQDEIRTEPTQAPLAAPATQSAPIQPARSEKAVTGLTQKAGQLMNDGKLTEAAAMLERAVRIEPSNAMTWHQLAQVRLRQGNYSQAINLAAKSNSLSTADIGLQAENWRLIARARRLMGDQQGAQQADAMANRLVPEK